MVSPSSTVSWAAVLIAAFVFFRGPLYFRDFLLLLLFYIITSYNLDKEERMTICAIAELPNHKSVAIGHSFTTSYAKTSQPPFSTTTTTTIRASTFRIDWLCCGLDRNTLRLILVHTRLPSYAARRVRMEFCSIFYSNARFDFRPVTFVDAIHEEKRPNKREWLIYVRFDQFFDTTVTFHLLVFGFRSLQFVI